MKTGIIKAIYDKEEYEGKYGHMYVYNMVIQYHGEEKQVTVEIKSKSHPYPAGNGDEITVEDTGNGKVKRVTEYQQKQQASGGGGGRDYKAENYGKVRTQLIARAIGSGQIKCDGKETCDYWTEYCMTGELPKAQDNSNTDPEVPW